MVTVIITTECAVVPVIEIVVTLDQIALLQSQMYLNVHKVRRENLRLRCYVNAKLYAKLYLISSTDSSTFPYTEECCVVKQNFVG